MKILIVDDSRAVRRVVHWALKRAGYGVHDIDEAEDGSVGLAKIETTKPDLVLCDWNMPRMSGIELLEILHARDAVPHFAFVTSAWTAQMRDRATGAGATAFVTKPFTSDSLQAAIGHFLD